ncbi:type II secretion system F family protein [Pelagibius litoralis]|uniref:type II secretion system F family protein n=1 Tax=Pelagibius litoralis TaxID=374515 RepID=UPI002AC3322F|nr:type II secretion system F family protein [Pelagibius litoralis]
MILPTLAILAVFLLIFGGDSSSKQTRRRVERVKAATDKAVAPSQSTSIRRSDTDSNIAVVDSLIKQLTPRPELLRLRLTSAGFSGALGRYLLIGLILGLATFGGLQLISFVPLIAAVLAGFFVAIMLPHAGLSFLIARRRNRFIAHFPEAIDLMVRGLRSGLPITESIKTAGDEIVDPVGSELSHVTNAVRLGEQLEEALWEASKRLNIQEFNFFTVALAIQSETGGNLAETLANLSDVLRRRRQLKLKIKALSSEAKASAYIIGSLPFIMGLLIFLVNPGYIGDLFEDPRGIFLLFLGFLSFAVGIGVMYRMVKFEI